MNFLIPLLGIFLKKSVFSFKDNIWGVDLADMKLISKYNKAIRYLLCAIELFSKYAFVVPLKGKKELLSLMHFKVFLTLQKNKKNNKTKQIKYGLIKVVNFN